MLNSIRCQTGSQWRCHSTGVMWSRRHDPVTIVVMLRSGQTADDTVDGRWWRTVQHIVTVVQASSDKRLDRCLCCVHVHRSLDRSRLSQLEVGGTSNGRDLWCHSQVTVYHHYQVSCCVNDYRKTVRHQFYMTATLTTTVTSVVTERILGENGCVGFNGLTRSELVFCLHAEFVLLAWFEILHYVRVLAAWNHAWHFLPEVRSVFTLFNHVSWADTKEHLSIMSYNRCT